MKTCWVRGIHCACVLALLGFGCRGGGSDGDVGQETETGDGDGDSNCTGDTGDGDGDTGDGDGDGDTGDGDGDTGDGDGDGDTGDGDGDGDGDTGDGDGDTGDGDGDGDTGDGDGDTGDGDGDTGDGDGDTGDGDGDTGGLSCEEIETEYNALAEGSTSCSAATDCQVLDGHCFMGLGGCWYVTNKDVSQSDLDNLANQYQGQGCFGPICFCLPPPGAVACVDGTCQAS